MNGPQTLFENGRYSASVQKIGDGLVLSLAGTIDESANFPALHTQLVPMLAGSILLNLDLGQIKRINSVGTRDWVLFVEQLQKITQLQFSLLSEPFVDQGLFVPNSLGKAGTRVIAFESPYLCEGCDARAMKILSPADVRTGPNGLSGPEFKCDQCGDPLLFDGIEDQYFHFTRRFKG